jgi:hypothetical protein
LASSTIGNGTNTGGLTIAGRATTTALTLTTLANALLSTDPSGLTVATTAVGVNYLTGTLPVSNGGTGSTNLGKLQLLATDSSGNVISTSTPTAAVFHATSTAATSTFAGGLAIETSGFVYDFSTNNVGIGTASPTTKLYVSSGDVTVTDGTGSLLLNDSGSIELERSTGSFLDFHDGSEDYDFRLKQESASNILSFHSSTTASILNILANGNVGIGTTSPANLLSVSGTSYFTSNVGIGTNDFTTDLAYVPKLKLSGTGPALYLNESDASQDWSLSGTGGNFAIRDGTVPAPRLVIQGTTGAVGIGGSITGATLAGATMVLTDGLVGIGTTTPTWLLNPSSATAPQLALSAGAGFSQWTFRNAGDTLYLATTTVAGTATSSLAALTIDTNGRVGIGSTSPLYAISAVGGAYLTGGLLSDVIASDGYNSKTSTVLWIQPTTTQTVSAGIVRVRDTSNTKDLFTIRTTGDVGIGTSTPTWLLNLSTSTAPQLALDSGAGQNPWTLRAVGGALFFATSTQTTFATSTVSAFAIDTNGIVKIANTASTTALNISGLGNTATNCLQVTSGGVVQANGSACGGAFPFTTTTFGATTANATSTLIGFTAGLYSLASSTIGNGTQTGGLTIAGGATTTLQAYFGDKVAIGTTTPWGLLSVNANALAAGTPQFVVGSSTRTNFIVANNGNVGIATSSPYANLSIYAPSTATNSTLFAIASSSKYGTSDINLLTLSSGGQLTLGNNIGFATGGVSSSTQLVVMAGTTTVTRVGQADLANGAAGSKSVYVQGRYAYITEGDTAGDTNGLEIFDVSDPSAPVLLSQTTLARFVVGTGAIYVQGRYAYIAESGTTNAFEIFDISNPAAPLRVSQRNLAAFNNGSGNTIYVQGRYAYIAEGGGTTNAFEIFDISNPAAPVRVSQSTLVNGGFNQVAGIHVQGNYAYIAEDGQGGGFEIFDISNPASPLRVASSTLANSATFAAAAIYVQDSYAYIVEGGGTTNAFEIFDISDPRSPSRVSQSTLLQGGSNGGADIYVQGRYAYITHGLSATNAIEIFDISNPASPTRVAQLNVSNGGSSGNSGDGIFVQGRYMYIAEGFGTTDAFEIFDLGGGYIQQFEAGGIETGTLAVRNNLFAVDGAFSGGLTVGGAFNGSLGNFLNYATTTTTKLQSALSAMSVDSNADSVSDVLSLTHAATSTNASTGFGVGLLFNNSTLCTLANCASATTTATSTARIASLTTDFSTTSPAADLAFYIKNSSTGLTEGMRLTSLGNLGIGTTTPNANLVVNGTTGQNLFQIATSTNQNIFIVDQLGYVEIGTSTALAELTVETRKSGGIAINGDGASHSPGYSLYATSTQRGALGLALTSGHYSSVSSLYDVVLRSSTADLILSAQNATGNILFTTGSTDSEKMTITNAGLVGIGDTTPTYDLDVTGLGRFTSLVDASHFIATSSSATSTFAGGLTVDTSDFVVDPDGGMVGIGTASPNFQAQLVGVGQLTADLTDAGVRTGALSLIGNSAAAGGGGALLFGSNQSFVANSVGFAAIKGLMTGGGGNVIGDLAFSTRNATGDTALTERMRILSTGLVGIGDTSPSQLLDIDGTDPQLLVEESTTEFLRAGVGETAGTSIIGWDDADSLRLGVYASPTDTTISDLVTILSTGLVGIGTTTPDSTLDVFSNTNALSVGNAAQLLLEGSSNNVGLQINNYQTGGRNWGIVSAGGSAGTAPSSLDFYDLTAGLSRLVINSSGYVGIGTTTPDTILSIQDTTSPTVLLALNDSTVSSAQETGALSFNVNDASSYGVVGKIANVSNGTTNNFGNLAFYTGSTAAALAEAMRIDSSGNVGIGTTTPQKNLSVVGAILAQDGSLITGSSGSEGGQITLGWSGAYPGASSNRSWTLDVFSDDDLRIFSQDASGATSQVFTIASSTGNIGVASSTPWGKLTVQQTGTGGAPAFIVEDQAADTSPFIIDQTGNVGIGMSPAFKLNVEVDSTTNPASGGGDGLTIDNADTTANSISTILFRANDSGGTKRHAGAIVMGKESDWSAGSYPGYIAFWNRAGAGSETESVRITGAGLVGIGTTSPNSLLEISGSNTGTTLATFTAGTTLGIGNRSTTNNTFSTLAFRTQDATNGAATSSAQIASVNNSHTVNAISGDLAFLTNNAGTLSEKMRILDSGEVGIGATAPVQLLEVADTTNPQIVIDESTTEFLRIGVGETAETAVIGWDDSDSLRLGVYSNRTETTITDFVTITSGGNVGIGTTTPVWQLNIASSTGPQFTLTDSASGTNLKHWTFRSVGGDLYISTSTDAYATSTAGNFAFGINKNAQVFMPGLIASSTAGQAVCFGQALNARGQITHTLGVAACSASSQRFKEDIQPLALSSGLQEVMALKPVSFKYKDSYLGGFVTDPNMNGHFVGFVAEDVAQVDPRLVTVDAQGIPDNVAYANITSVLTKAVQQIHGAYTLQNPDAAATSTIVTAYEGTTTQAITVSAAGDVGIGTNAPGYTLQVAGEVGAEGFVNTSTRALKTDISYLSAEDASTTLAKLQKLRPATYRYINDRSNEARLGLIAEDARAVAPEILSFDGNGVDLYKLATFTLQGMQALVTRIDAQEVRLVSLEDRLAALESGAISFSSDTSPFSTSTLTEALADLGVLIEKGIARLDTLVARRFVAMTGPDGAASAGSASISGMATSTVVANSLVASSTKVLVTMGGPIRGNWWVSDKTDGSFRVNFSEPQAASVAFDYFLVQTEGAPSTDGQVTSEPAGVLASIFEPLYADALTSTSTASSGGTTTATSTATDTATTTPSTSSGQGATTTPATSTGAATEPQTTSADAATTSSTSSPQADPVPADATTLTSESTTSTTDTTAPDTTSADTTAPASADTADALETIAF